MTRQKQAHGLRAQVVPRWQDLVVTLLILAAGTAIGNLFWQSAFTKANIISVYVLGTLLTSLFTRSYFCGVLSSVASVLLFNFFFTEPRLTLQRLREGLPHHHRHHAHRLHHHGDALHPEHPQHRGEGAGPPCWPRTNSSAPTCCGPSPTICAPR